MTWLFYQKRQKIINYSKERRKKKRLIVVDGDIQTLSMPVPLSKQKECTHVNGALAHTLVYKFVILLESEHLPSSSPVKF